MTDTNKESSALKDAARERLALINQLRMEIYAEKLEARILEEQLEGYIIAMYLAADVDFFPS